MKTALLWVQLLVGSAMGQKRGFGLNHCSPLSENTEDDWELEERGMGFERLFCSLHSAQQLPGSEENNQSPVISHQSHYYIANTAILVNFLCNLSSQPMECSEREGLLAVRI